MDCIQELHFKTEALRVYRLQTACTDIRPIEAMWVGTCRCVREQVCVSARKLV